MLWDIRARMRPALSIIDLIPDVHRTAALSALRRAVVENKPAVLRLSPEERELAFLDAPVQLSSPIGARVLKALYFSGNLKLKKPRQKALPHLEAYIETEAAFRAAVAEIEVAAAAKRARLDAIIADPAVAQPDELTPALIDKVFTAKLGHGATGSLQIAGIECHRDLVEAPNGDPRLRPEMKLISWWVDANGTRQGDAESA